MMKRIDLIKEKEQNKQDELFKEQLKRKLAYYFVFNNPIVFRDFWAPKMLKRRYKTRYYQYAPALSENMSWGGARTLGKTDELVFSMIFNALKSKMKESLLTAFRRIHVKKPLESLIGNIINVPFLRKFLKGDADKTLKGSVSRTPVYSIKFKNGHEILGISIGEDPAAVMIQGSHPHFRYMDEGQTYPEASWVKFQSTQAQEGSVDRYFGTCLLPGIKIRLKDKIVPIEDVKKGDLVLTHKGRYRKVSSLKIRNYSGKIIKFKTQLNHIPIAITDDHLVYGVKSLPCWSVTLNCYPRNSKKCLKCHRKQYLSYNPSWFLINDLKKGDYVVFPRNIDNESKALKEIDLTYYDKNKKGPKIKLNKIIVDKNFIIIVGAYLAEGSVDYGRVTFCFRKDEEIAILTKEALKRKKIDFSSKFRKEGDMEYVRVCDVRFFRMMTELFGIGAQGKKIPDWFLNLSNNLIEKLFKIYFLGDGHTRRRLNRKSETVAPSVSENLLSQLQLLSFKIKKDSSLRLRNKEKFCSIFGQSPSLKKAVFEIGYNKTRMIFEKDRYIYLRIIDYKKQNFSGKVYNIEVEEDKSYCSGLTFLHNCDGRLNTPFYLINHKLSKFKGNRFFIPRMLEPWFDQKKNQDYVQAFGSEQSNEYQQQVLALEGEPIWSLWSQRDILKNIDMTETKNGVLANSLITIKISQGDIENGIREKVGDSKDPKLLGGALEQLFEELFSTLPSLPNKTVEVILGIDAGWSEPTAILPFFFYENKWNLRCKILLSDKMIPDFQTLAIDYIATKYNNSLIGIDTSDGEGKALATSLANPARPEFAGKGYAERVIWIEFQKKMITGYMPDETPIEQKIKERTTKELQNWFSEAKFKIYHDEDFLADFDKEVRKKTSTGYLIFTPSDVHIPEAMRVFMFVWLEKYGRIDIPSDEEGEFEDYGMLAPETGDLDFDLFGRPGKESRKANNY